MKILKNLLPMNHNRARKSYIGHAFIAAEEEIKDLEPSSYIEANSCKDVAQWQLAMMEEIESESIHKNET